MSDQVVLGSKITTLNVTMTLPGEIKMVLSGAHVGSENKCGH